MKNIAVVYWSGTGNTEMMAQAIAEGIEGAGATVTVFTATEFNVDQVANFDVFAFGCPSMGAEELEDSEFEPMFTAVESALQGKTIALFGSYGWGDGEWMRIWQQRCTDVGINLLDEEGLILNETPDDDGLELCRALGKRLAS